MCIIAVSAAIILAKTTGHKLEGEGRWLVVLILFFSGALVWRDSPTLNAANTGALVTSIGLGTLTARSGQLRRAGVSQYALGVLYALACAVAGLFPVLRRDIAWRSFRLSGPALAAGRGVFFALPPLIVFGTLFAAADAHFASLLDVFRMDASELSIRVTLIVLYTWLAGGLLREMLLARRVANLEWHKPGIGTIELDVVLGLLDVLFATFVLLQVPYLFGGHAQINSLGYSEYARRGFFELVWVVGLMLPLLLVLHWLKNSATFRVLAATMVGLLFVIMASAVQRMQIYVADAGLTELRVQASAFMLWLAIVLVWFILTVLRTDQRQRFAFGALVSGFALVALLDFANPDDVIVRTNTVYGHLLNNGSFDERPLASLSSDATPAIVDALPALPEPQRQQTIDRLRRKLASTEPGDWRSFIWSREQAETALNQLH